MTFLDNLNLRGAFESRHLKKINTAKKEKKNMQDAIETSGESF